MFHNLEQHDLEFLPIRVMKPIKLILKYFNEQLEQIERVRNANIAAIDQAMKRKNLTLFHQIHFKQFIQFMNLNESRYKMIKANLKPFPGLDLSRFEPYYEQLGNDLPKHYNYEADEFGFRDIHYSIIYDDFDMFKKLYTFELLPELVPLMNSKHLQFAMGSLAGSFNEILERIIDINDHELLELFLERYKSKINLTRVNAKNRCVLFKAVAQSNANLVKQLIEAQFSVNSTDIIGQSVLHVAAQIGNTEIVSLLLNAGSDVNVIDFLGLSPLDYAAYLGKFEGLIVEKYGKGVTSNTKTEIIKRKGPAVLTNTQILCINFGSINSRKPLIREKPFEYVLIQANEDSVLCHFSASSAELSLSCDVDIYHTEVVFTFLNYFKKPIGECRMVLANLVHPSILYRDDADNKPNVFRTTFLSTHVLNHLVIRGEGQVYGQLAIETLMIKPYNRAQYSVNSVDNLPKRGELVGHRGCGANSGLSYPQIAENTILSFNEAGRKGARFVEFDVQITRDGVPVLYHDWAISESGLDIPVSAISLRKFKALRGDYQRTRTRDDMLIESKNVFKPPHYSTVNLAKFTKLLETTVNDSFCTLEEAFKGVENKIGFNVEVKYPALEECEIYGLFCDELNEFLDTIIECVYKNAGNRPLYFSSFHPDVCRMLKMKQNVYPVLYLTVGGRESFIDKRLNSLADAVETASDYNLDGIVTDSSPLIQAPRLINFIQSKGLVVASYGSKNNIREYVKLQRDFGIDAVITDKIKEMSQ